MKKYFITFGAGGQNFIDAGNRLMLQASSLELFDVLKFYTEIDLKLDKEFWNKHKMFITTNKRGYGYWLWKSYIIKKTMKLMSEGDILLYLDCGCEIDIRKKPKMIELFDIVKKDYIVGSQTCNEQGWNKMDLLLHLDMNKPQYLITKQRQGGTNMFILNTQTKQLVDEWYSISCNYHMIDDSPSIAPNLPCFKEHRHDQSIFSLLTKKYNIYSDHNISECVEILRNKQGKSKLIIQ